MKPISYQHTILGALPKELQKYIIYSLCDPRTRNNLRLTCKALHKIARKSSSVVTALISHAPHIILPEKHMLLMKAIGQNNIPWIQQLLKVDAQCKDMIYPIDTTAYHY